MKRDALETLNVPTWPVRTRKQSSDVRGNQTAGFVRALTSVQTLATAGSHRAGEQPELRMDESGIGGPTGDVLRDSGLSLPQPGWRMENNGSRTGSASALGEHEATSENGELDQAAKRGLVVDEHPFIASSISYSAAGAVERAVERTNALPSELKTGEQHIERADSPLPGLKDRNSVHVAIAPDSIETRGSAGEGFWSTITRPKEPLNDAPGMAPSAFAGDMRGQSHAAGDRVSESGRETDPVDASSSQSEPEVRFDRMSVRVDVNTESAFALKASEKAFERIATPQWAAEEQPAQKSRFAAAPANPGIHEAAADDPGASTDAATAAKDENAPQWIVGDRPLLLKATSLSADRPTEVEAGGGDAPSASRVMNHASHPAGEAQADENAARGWFLASARTMTAFLGGESEIKAARGNLAQEIVSNGPLSMGSAPRADFARALLHDLGNDGRTQNTEIMAGLTPGKETTGKGLEHRIEIPVLDAEKIETHHGDAGTGLESERPNVSPEDPLPPMAPIPRRFDLQTRPGNFDDRLSRPDLTRVVPRGGEANAAASSKQVSVFAAGAAGAGHAEPRNAETDASIPDKRNSSAMENKNNIAVQEERQSPAQPSSPGAASSAPWPPHQLQDMIQPVGQARGEQGGGTPPHSLEQILSSLQLELSAFKRSDSAPLKQLKIRLHPESLGEVDVTLRKNGRGMDVQLDASLGSTAAALQAAKDELASALAEFGFDRSSLSIDVRTSGQIEVQQEIPAGKDLQQAKSGIDQQHLAEQNGERRRERKSDEGRNEEIERGSHAVRDGSAPRGKRGIYV